MSSKKLSAGDVIEAQCTRCRTLTNHTIVAMVGERVVRVQCNTCDGVHNYKAAQPAKAPAVRSTGPKQASAPRTSRKDPHAAEREEWLALRPSMLRELAKTYDMNGSYKVNDLVEHPVFGLGIVQRVLANKVEILFEQGRKLLRSR